MHGTRTRTPKMRREFLALHVATLTPATTPTQLAAALTAADGVQERHRLSEGAVYATACRRYLLDTGTSWKAPAPEAAAWGAESAHRSRLTPSAWRCSCGAQGTAADPGLAHAAHVQDTQAVAS